LNHIETTVEGRGHAFKSFDPAQKAAIQLPVRQLERGALLGRRRRRGGRFRHGDSLDRHSCIALLNGDRSKHDGFGESDTHGVANSSLGRAATFGQGPRQREAHEYGTVTRRHHAHRFAVGVAPRKRVPSTHGEALGLDPTHRGSAALALSLVFVVFGRQFLAGCFESVAHGYVPGARNSLEHAN